MSWPFSAPDRPLPRAAKLRGYGEGSRREFRVREPRLKDMSNTNEDGVRHAIAARERGRDKVRTATTAVAVASVAAAGAFALVLPGSTHASASTSTGSTSSGSTS